MKKLLIFLLLFVNLQIVIQESGIDIQVVSTASAQRFVREIAAGIYECEDIYTLEHYLSSLSTCAAESADPEKFECPHCHAIFYVEENMKLHEQTCSSKPKEEFACPNANCDAVFKTAKDLSDHLLTCGSYSCTYPNCGQRFQSQTDLDEHAKTHNSSGGGSSGGTSGGSSGGSSGVGGSTSSSGGGGGGGSHLLPEVTVTAKGVSKRESYYIQPNCATCVPSALGNSLLLKNPQLTCEQIADSVARWRQIHDNLFPKEPIDENGVRVSRVLNYYRQLGFKCREAQIGHLKLLLDAGRLVVGFVRVWDVGSSSYLVHAVTIYSVGLTMGEETFYSAVNSWTGKEELYNKGEFYPYAFEVFK